MRNMTPSQYANYLRQQQNKLNQAIRQRNQEIDRINRLNRAEVNRVNQHNRRVVEKNNRVIREHNRNAKNAVAKYNSAVRSHNAAVERDRQRTLQRLRSSTTTRYVEVRQSTFDLSDRYAEMESSQNGTDYADLVTLSEREASNSARVAEALVADAPAEPGATDDAGVLDYLAGFSQDLCDRWTGALYALSPSNPDAGRHFCTSAREIFTEILERSADNSEVLEDDPNCERAPHSSVPSRRAKLRYLLRRKGADTPQMVGFVEKDIDDVLQLFRVFNEATHGSAGKHGLAKLRTIRQRVEGGVMFLAAVAL